MSVSEKKFGVLQTGESAKIYHLENKSGAYAEVTDFGAKEGERCDYPTVGIKVGEEVAAKNFDCGVLICGTGVGISIAANKVKGIRAGVCSDTATARLIKQHNNANIIAFGARIVGTELAKDIVKSYLEAEFEGERHQRRIDMISDYE